MAVTFSTRVGSYAQNSFMISNLSRMQKTMADLQVQQATLLKSQQYTGIGVDTYRLVNMETQVTKIDTYYTTNQNTTLSVKLMTQAVESIDSDLSNAIAALKEFNSLNITPGNLNKDQQAKLDRAQEAAFSALQGLAESLNSTDDGSKYLFSGGKSDTAPVKFAYSSLKQFQADWDGKTMMVPQSRTADMNDFRHIGVMTFRKDLTEATAAGYVVPDNLTDLNTKNKLGAIEFPNGASNPPVLEDVTIPAGQTVTNKTFEIANAGDVKAGDVLRVQGGDGKVYQVTVDKVDGDGKTITMKRDGAVPDGVGVSSVEKVNLPQGIVSVTGAGLNTGDYRLLDVYKDASGNAWMIVDPPPGDPGTSTTAATLERNIYYQGDELSTKYNLSENRTLEVGVNAKDAAFEKAYRALALVAMGNLENDPERGKEAMDLLNDARKHNPKWPEEEASDLQSVGSRLSLDYATVQNTMESQKNTINYLTSAANDIKGVNSYDVAAQITAQLTYMQASYAAFAMGQQLSLVDYL
ncbi:hypothetical protein IHV25_07980 [Phaeovibrio sulfidiphilus]|uniref:Uncharacterized protein n=1 Tax=Phaeovibrio sulfidiphilus TaxID=1220600 RepID=A0A8J6YMX7_9PROT|nr:flagellin [Phaeovibrio sulfidiphilus]MBE1237585.1 hypothetical protein [Phaeovibrio sulfidiphilus]